MKRFLFLAYLTALHLLLGGLVINTDLRAILQHWVNGTAAPNAHVQRMVRFHATMDPFVPAGAAIFLGDSITQGLATTAVAPDSVNYGIGALTTRDLLNNLSLYQSLARSRAIFLMVGINDIGQGATQGLQQRLQKISEGLPREVPLVWSAVMPSRRPADRPGVEEANAAIAKLCSARSHCIFVDTDRLFSGGGASFYEDNIHPNAAGYAAWIGALRAAYRSIPPHGLTTHAPQAPAR